MTPYFFHLSSPKFLCTQLMIFFTSVFHSGKYRGCSIINRAQVMALICVSLQMPTSSKNGPHLLVFEGYFMSHFTILSAAILYDAILPFLSSIRSQNICSVGVR